MSLKRIAAAVVAVFLLGLAVAGGLAWHAGYRVYAVQTGSMVPTFQPGDLVIDRPADEGYRPGDVITFRHSTGPDLVTHRLKAITPQGIHTKGDGNRSADTWDIRPDQVEGVGVSNLANMGYALVFLKQPLGVLGVMTSALSVILLWGICFPAEGAVETSAKKSRTRFGKARQQLLPGV
jgi:signal peptidase I